MLQLVQVAHGTRLDLGQSRGERWCSQQEAIKQGRMFKHRIPVKVSRTAALQACHGKLYQRSVWMGSLLVLEGKGGDQPGYFCAVDERDKHLVGQETVLVEATISRGCKCQWLPTRPLNTMHECQQHDCGLGLGSNSFHLSFSEGQAPGSVQKLKLRLLRESRHCPPPFYCSSYLYFRGTLELRRTSFM